MVFNWNNEKNEELKRERRVSFEQIVLLIKNVNILDILEHSKKEKYQNQRLYVIDIDNYAYVAPFIDKKGERFLKTIFPGRKYTNIYLRKKEKKMKFNLDKEEKELLESIDRDEWESISNPQEEIERSKKIARATIVKDQRMNIRISKKDLDALKIRAIEEGMPYQTLVSSILHKYLAGKLVEKSS